MMNRLLAFVMLGALATTDVAVAAPQASLVFTTPTAAAGPTDNIDVYVTLTLDPASVALTTDASGTVTSGYGAGDLPSGFNVTSSNLNMSFSCSGTFTDVCTNGPPYDFNFAYPSFSYAQNLNIQPGGSETFLFGTFTPTGGGPVAPATYTFFNTSFFIQLYDNTQNDPNNGTPPWQFDVAIASTCDSSDVSCSFQRTVVAVPEPETYAMLMAGLGLVGFAARRRASHGRA
jgi:hypothetical protein